MTNSLPQGKKSMHKAAHDPRAAALVALLAVIDGKSDSQAALDTAVSSPDMVPTDKRLCTELVYGSLRQYLRLEWFLRQFLQKPEKLPQEMSAVLIIALYEMTFLRIPPHATLNWAVEHVNNRFGQALGRVANGVLRSIQRSLPEFHRPSLYAKSFSTLEEQLACLYAMPLWILQLWKNAYGYADTIHLLHASHEAAPSGLRLNRRDEGWKHARDGLLQSESLQDEKLPESRRMKTGTEATAVVASLLWERAGMDAASFPAQFPRISTAEAVGSCALAFGGALPWAAKTLLREKKAERQSPASFAALEAFKPETWTLPIWDCCAGRGGKTLALLERGIPVALASDSSKTRIAALQTNLFGKKAKPQPPSPVGSPLPYPETAHAPLFAVKEGSRNLPDQNPLLVAQPNDNAASAERPELPRIMCGSALNVALAVSQDPSLPSQFGTILIDAPCSGLGTLAHRPEIRLRRTAEDLASLVDTQKRLLEAARTYLIPGGRIVYLTCTRNPAENEGQIAAFLAAHSDITLKEEYYTPADSPWREFFYGALLEKQ